MSHNIKFTFHFTVSAQYFVSCNIVVTVFKFQQTTLIRQYTGCPRMNGQNFGRVLNCTDITQNTYIQS